MKHLKIFNLLVMSLLVFAATPSWACLSFPKNVKLKNSPFPFSEFDIFSDSFNYTAPDGSRNSLSCTVKDKFSWDVRVWEKDKPMVKYAYEDLKGAKIYADENESDPKTTIILGDTADMAYASIKKGKASLQVTCHKDGNFQRLSVRVINTAGKAIGEISSSKDMRLGLSRSLSKPKKENGEIDFNSSQQVGGEFVSSGCGFQKEVEQGSSSSTSGVEN